MKRFIKIIACITGVIGMALGTPAAWAVVNTATNVTGGSINLSNGSVTLNNASGLSLIKAVFDSTGTCVASSDSDLLCGSVSTVTVPTGANVTFLVYVKNGSGLNMADIRFKDILDETASGFTYVGTLQRTATGGGAPASSSDVNALFAAASTTVTAAIDGDVGSARDLVNTGDGIETIEFGQPNNPVLVLNASKAFAIRFVATKK